MGQGYYPAEKNGSAMELIVTMKQEASSVIIQCVSGFHALIDLVFPP
jgi:hypothetical protein